MPRPLDAAAALLRGEKSFAAFARAGQEHRGDRCIVTEARWAPWDLGTEFTILANRFLHHMVRYLVGTMVDIARGRRPLDDMRAMLEGNEKGLVTSPPAPAAGLFLRRVSYPAHAIAHITAIPDDSGRESGNAATVADAPPESARSVPFARPRRIRFRHRPPTRRERQPLMKIFLDTADLGEIRRAAAGGLIDGVTTNPSLLAKVAGDRDPMEIFLEICEAIDGPVSAEVVGVDTRTMIDEGTRLAAIHPNIAVKVPLTEDGLVACRELSSRGIPVNVTLCFSAPQALLAAKAGAAYISPFIGRLDDISHDGMELIRQIRRHLRQLRHADRDSGGFPPAPAPRRGVAGGGRRRRHPAAGGAAQADPPPADRPRAGRLPGRLGETGT